MLPVLHAINSKGRKTIERLLVSDNGIPIVPPKGEMLFKNGELYRVDDVVWDYDAGAVRVVGAVVDADGEQLLCLSSFRHERFGSSDEHIFHECAYRRKGHPTNEFSQGELRHQCVGCDLHWSAEDE